jgi:hypothetical protein
MVSSCLGAVGSAPILTGFSDDCLARVLSYLDLLGITLLRTVGRGGRYASTFFFEARNSSELPLPDLVALDLTSGAPLQGFPSLSWFLDSYLRIVFVSCLFIIHLGSVLRPKLG